MWTIIHLVAFIWIALAAARAPASLSNSANIDVRHSLYELYPSDTHVVLEMRAPIKDNQDYTNCVPQPKGLGPRPEQDTPHAFRYFKPFHDASNSAQIPQGYELGAQDLDGSVESDLGFLGTHLVEQYSPYECARLCDDLPTCASFNLYFERAPTFRPDVNAGCPDPPSSTNINCVLWHARLDADALVNFGQIREEFQVVITGSNLYNKINGTLDLGHLGFSGPWVGVDNEAAFEVPDEPMDDYNTLLLQKILYYSSFDSSSILAHYDPTICANLCSNITNRAEPALPFTHNAFPVCSMFVAYEMRHDVALAMVCELYSSVWSSRYQTLREVVAFTGQGKETVTLRPTKVSVYHRNDYQYPPICAMEYQCGKDFYAGGDCSGWGKGFC